MLLCRVRDPNFWPVLSTINQITVLSGGHLIKRNSTHAALYGASLEGLQTEQHLPACNPVGFNNPQHLLQLFESVSLWSISLQVEVNMKVSVSCFTLSRSPFWLVHTSSCSSLICRGSGSSWSRLEFLSWSQSCWSESTSSSLQTSCCRWSSEYTNEEKLETFYRQMEHCVVLYDVWRGI